MVNVQMHAPDMDNAVNSMHAFAIVITEVLIAPNVYVHMDMHL